ncbi:hypothetical protein [Rhizobium sp. SL86]|uniref:hypothetical protein n=1 Tax=Rhizobium sp. SL86 TaxID=2995148 RepID=UPI002275A2C8|nr:hypothetical protein [Rhizobium sp. SL86]MCY1667897.1 hypothetical protein [Rhizobium sp. SL86]
MTNPYSEDERLGAMINATFRAVRAHFNHLPMRDIIDPPRDMFDAKLARQIVIAILNSEFTVPRRRLVALLGVARWSVMQANRVVRCRRDEGCFDRAYERMAMRAHEIFMASMLEAAAAQAEAA